jgi:hypothetical protein
MKLTKMLGLAMVAAIAVIAFAGVGSASATQLCKNKEGTCEAWPEHSTILALSTNAVLRGSLAVECHSHVTVLTEKNDAGQILGKITLLDWTSCKGSCPKATTKVLPTGSLFATSGGNGTLKTESETQVALEGCFGFATCTAKAGAISLGFDGGAIGSTAQTLATNVPVAISGFGCGEKGTWNADGKTEGSQPYVITEVNGSKTGNIFVR